MLADFFEHLVVELLVKMGYGGSRKDAGERIGQSGDGGIDGIIKEDRLGLDTIFIQAKRWQGSVGRPAIQKFVGALQGQRARKGVFITTSTYTTEAHLLALTTKRVQELQRRAGSGEKRLTRGKIAPSYPSTHFKKSRHITMAF